MRMCGVCLREIGYGGKSEMFESVGSCYKTKRRQRQMQYMQYCNSEQRRQHQ